MESISNPMRSNPHFDQSKKVGNMTVEELAQMVGETIVSITRYPLAKSVERGIETTLHACGESNPYSNFYWVPFSPLSFWIFYRFN